MWMYFLPIFTGIWLWISQVCECISFPLFTGIWLWISQVCECISSYYWQVSDFGLAKYVNVFRPIIDRYLTLDCISYHYLQVSDFGLYFLPLFTGIWLWIVFPTIIYRYLTLDCISYHYLQVSDFGLYFLPLFTGIWLWIVFPTIIYRYLTLDCISYHYLQVSDFGLAKYGDFNTEGGKFPIKWTAPEALKKNVSFQLLWNHLFLWGPIFVGIFVGT